jgi:solute carrier family 25 (mitochondrial aspartate/glutamate transporter), member 12/13
MRLLLPVALMGFTDNEFTQLMKGLQGERLRQAFRYFDDNQDGVIRPDQFKRIILVRRSRSLLQFVVIMTSVLQELAGHKLSDAVIELLPTLTALTPGGRISFSEVVACHNVIRGMFYCINPKPATNDVKFACAIRQKWT